MSGDTLRYLYFDLRARGELPRLVAAVTGLKLKDELYRRETFKDLRDKTPYKQLPCLEIGDKLYAQKIAISFYMAELANKDLLGKDALETLAINQSIFFTEDVLELIIVAFEHRDIHNLGMEKLDNLRSTIFPIKLPLLEKQLEGKEGGYLVGNRMTVAELAAFDVLEHVVDLEGLDYLDKYPCCKVLFERTAAIPGMVEYRTNLRNKNPWFFW